MRSHESSVAQVAKMSNSEARTSDISTARQHETIPFDSGCQMTRRFRAGRDKGSRKAGFFGKGILERIINQRGCIGVRAFYAQEENGDPTLVLAGIHAGGDPIPRGVLGEDVIACPPWCPSPNGLSYHETLPVRPRTRNRYVLSGRENHDVTVAEAVRLIGNAATIAKEDGHMARDFSVECLRQILSHDKHVGIRFYWGKQEDNEMTLLAVAVEQNGDDVLDGGLIEGNPYRDDGETAISMLIGW